MTDEEPSRPVDPDVDVPFDADLGLSGRADPPVAAQLPLIALGGMVGALARWALAVHLPTTPGGMPWATLTVNVTGSLLLVLLMARLAAHPRANPYLRPFLGVGVLGGYTTFSTYATDGRALLADGHAGLSVAYLLGTILVCLAAALAGLRLGRARPVATEASQG